MTDSVCYRHPDRPAGVRCQRCDRPICPDCMNSAAVGFQCPECFSSGVKSIPKTRTTMGGVARVNDQVVTLTLMALNVLVWIAVVAGGDQVWQKLVMYGPLADDEPWRLITSAFTHERFFHIFANLFMLYQLGPPLERMLGRLRFIILYLASAIGGSLAVWLLDPNQPTLGASGAVLGLVGAFLVISRSLGHDVTWIVLYIGITAFLSFAVPNISWQGHLGGFVVGAALGALFVYQSKRRTRTPDRG
jgi:membrane associated rhomboid family serine protease